MVKRDRSELARLLEHLRQDHHDVVVVTRLDRLAHSTRDLLEIAEVLNKIGAGLRSINEPWADTSSPAGKMIRTVFAGIAGFKRTLIIERTKSGREIARKKGVRFGRPPKLSSEQALLGMRLLTEGKSVREAARILNCHHATLYRAKTALATTDDFTN